MLEPILDISDIQGHVAPGFKTKYQRFVFLAINDPVRAAPLLARWIDKVTTLEQSHKKRLLRTKCWREGKEQPVDTEISQAICLSASGLRKMSFDPEEASDPLFSGAMHHDAISYKDPVDKSGRPTGWLFGSCEADAPDVLFVLGSDEKQKLQVRCDNIIHALGSSCSVIYVENGETLDNDQEHFGFRDNVSKLALAGRVSETEFFEERTINSQSNFEGFARPGRPLVWPGTFIFGLPSQGISRTQPGPVYRVPEWLHNGSLLVFRRLGQKVGLFRSETKRLAEAMTAAVGCDIGHDTAKALLVGRWPDGTPLVSSPHGPNISISSDRNRNNHFGYDLPTPAYNVQQEDGVQHIPRIEADPLGLVCPFTAHIRKINPRDSVTDLNDPMTTLRKQILRRSIPFGEPLAEGQDDETPVRRGLLFMCYQTSIYDQFAFLTRNWVNSRFAPRGIGIDPLIGQSGDGTLTFTWMVGGRNHEFKIQGDWIVPTGGGYFLTPGIKGLRRILAAC